MDHLLLGGWRHVAEDVRQLDISLKALPDTCTCHDGAAHLIGTCPCCLSGQRALDSGCSNCESLLALLREEMDDLTDATLRFLPFVEVNTSGHELRRKIMQVAAVFQRLETAADEFRRGCPSSHVAVLKALAAELVVSVREVDVKLRPLPPETERALWLR